MFTLAHFSDLHLGPLPRGALWHNFKLKRLIGGASWNFNRHRLHLPHVGDLIARDIRADNPDHIAFTGDAVNLSAFDEFPRAAQWMAQLADPMSMTFVPGNHDAYVPVPWANGLAHLAPWMKGDMRIDGVEGPFPFVRLRKNVALIGLSTGGPQPLRKAGGTLGDDQLRPLPSLLRDLRERGFARVILIHHPPFPGLAKDRKALTDAAALRDIIAAEGADLILHGHNHCHVLTPLTTRLGIAHAVGVPSASISGEHGHTPAAWYRYAIERSEGRWRVDVRVRAYDRSTGEIRTASEFPLSS